LQTTVFPPFLAPTGAWGMMKFSVSLQFLSLGQSVGLLGQGISSSQDLYLHRINVHIYINIHASSRIRTYDPGIQASQGSSYPRPPGYRDRLQMTATNQN
jgi:hypothetical protein